VCITTHMMPCDSSALLAASAGPVSAWQQALTANLASISQHTRRHCIPCAEHRRTYISHHICAHAVLLGPLPLHSDTWTNIAQPMGAIKRKCSAVAVWRRACKVRALTSLYNVSTSAGYHATVFLDARQAKHTPPQHACCPEICASGEPYRTFHPNCASERGALKRFGNMVL
jgi:hypothetical protein